MSNPAAADLEQMLSGHHSRRFVVDAYEVRLQFRRPVDNTQGKPSCVILAIHETLARSWQSRAHRARVLTIVRFVLPLLAGLRQLTR